MKIRTNPAVAALAATLALALPAGALAQAAAESKPAKPAAAAPAKSTAQRSFASPEEAAKALYDAVKAADVKALVDIVGPQSRSWLFTGDKVSDAEDWKRFAASYDEKHSFAKEGDAKAVLIVGKDDYPFAAPVVKRGDKWAFDAEAGREEVINRRVGRNELDTIQTLLAIVDAQREYAVADADKNGFNDYAVRFISSPGKKDGLYWPTKAGEPQSPLGPLVAQAVREGYGNKVGTGQPQPYNGYYFRLLKGQGANAPGGKYSYEVRGKLFGGFAVVAYPAKYGVSGVMSFLVNHDGVVYEKDLGASTPSVA
ncbi:MAG TPA: DUF2950 domain-containing protein, partial [Usitatibacteraceae bacterium]|nr:DUF2950 domain-containing protein [Usitatibacteraceae bacterium]